MTIQTQLQTVPITPDVIVLTNVFAVQPEQQQLLIDAIAQFATNIACKQPGFVSTTILRGIDGKSVTASIQWRSQDHLDACLQEPAAQEQIELIEIIGELQSSVLSHLCANVAPTD